MKVNFQNNLSEDQKNFLHYYKISIPLKGEYDKDNEPIAFNFEEKDLLFKNIYFEYNNADSTNYAYTYIISKGANIDIKKYLNDSNYLKKLFKVLNESNFKFEEFLYIYNQVIETPRKYIYEYQLENSLKYYKKLLLNEDVYLHKFLKECSLDDEDSYKNVNDIFNKHLRVKDVFTNLYLIPLKYLTLISNFNDALTCLSNSNEYSRFISKLMFFSTSFTQDLKELDFNLEKMSDKTWNQHVNFIKETYEEIFDNEDYWNNILK